jgi:hypothetical protein
VATSVHAGEDPVIFATNPTFSGSADANLFGQTFTTSAPVEITCVEVFVERESGGSSFQLFIQPYDPWTRTRGAPIASVTVPLSALPIAPEGGWMAISVSPPAVLSNPGVFGVFLDTDSEGFPDGYNSYGYSEGDSVAGGRIVNPTFTRDVEMMLRLRGDADTGAFEPPKYTAPRFTSITSERKNTASGTLTFVRFSWQTESGAVYRILRSEDLVRWRDSNLLRLGDGLETFYEATNEIHSKRFIKVEVQPLGDYKP